MCTKMNVRVVGDGSMQVGGNKRVFMHIRRARTKVHFPCSGIRNIGTTEVIRQARHGTRCMKSCTRRHSGRHNLRGRGIELGVKSTLILRSSCLFVRLKR